MRLSIAAIFTVFVSLALAQYLYDDWSDGNADGWVEMDSLVTYEVTDSLTYRFSYQGGQEANGLSYWGTEMPNADYQILTHFMGHGPTDYVGAEARFDPTVKTGYVAYASYEDDEFVIAKYTPGYVVLAYMSFSLEYDVAYSMKLNLNGTELKAKIWLMDETEPSGWMLETTDSQFTDPLYVLLEAFRTPQGTFDAEFYSILVEDVSALEQSTWGAIKYSF